MSRYRTGEDREDLFKWLAKLNERVNNLESGNRVGFTAVDSGSFVVKDASGNTIVEVGKASDGLFGLTINNQGGDPQIRAGELVSGGHGLEVVNANGKLVKLSTLAFGIRSENVNNFEGTTSIAFTNLATIGPIVNNVEIGSSGRCLVIVSARMATNNDGGSMSFDISGATTQAASGTRKLELESITAQANGSMSRVFLVVDLNAGLHTFTAKYASISGGTANFADRNLTILPF